MPDNFVRFPKYMGPPSFSTSGLRFGQYWTTTGNAVIGIFTSRRGAVTLRFIYYHHSRRAPDASKDERQPDPDQSKEQEFGSKHKAGPEPKPTSRSLLRSWVLRFTSCTKWSRWLKESYLTLTEGRSINIKVEIERLKLASSGLREVSVKWWGFPLFE